MHIQTYSVVLYNADLETDEKNAERFFVSKEKYAALINEATLILMGSQGRWRILSRHSFFVGSIISNTHFLILTLKKINEPNVHYPHLAIGYVKDNPVF